MITISIIALLGFAYAVACICHGGVLFIARGTWNEAYGRVFTYKRVYSNWKTTPFVTVTLRRSRWPAK